MRTRTISEAVDARRERAPTVPARTVLHLPTCAACHRVLSGAPVWTLYVTDSDGRDGRPLVDVKVCHDCIQGARDNRDHGAAVTRALLDAHAARAGS